MPLSSTRTMVVFRTNLMWLQGAFATLTGLFNRVGLRTNAGKTVVMLRRTCRVVGTQSEEAYEHRMMGMRLTYRDR